MERRHRNYNGYYYNNDCGYEDKSHIQHPVSKFDTLAGIAIKYGVEVADIKKMNGLSTDLQMFALKSLQIPLPGKHPPSSLPCGYGNPGQTTCDQTPQRHMQIDPFHSFQSLRLKSSPERKISPAMSSLQGYYGLQPTDGRPTSEGFKMMVYRNGGARKLEDRPLLKPYPTSNVPLDSSRKSRSFANFNLVETGDKIHDSGVRQCEPEKRNKKLVRRRQKSEVDFASTESEMVLKEKEDNSNGDAFPAITGKGLGPRPRSASRSTLAADAERGGTGLTPVPFTLGDCLLGDQFSGVRKSSSTSNLQDQDATSFSSIWPTPKWDLQALSTVAIAKPIFDGLPKPISGRRNKTALD